MSTTASKPPCPNSDCPAPHVVRNGTLKGRQRYHCKGCGAWFGEHDALLARGTGSGGALPDVYGEDRVYVTVEVRALAGFVSSLDALFYVPSKLW